MASLVIGYRSLDDSDHRIKIIFQKYRRNDFYKGTYKVFAAGGILSSYAYPAMDSIELIVRGSDLNADAKIIFGSFDRDSMHRHLKRVLFYNKILEPHIDFQIEDVCIECRTLKALEELEY